MKTIVQTNYSGVDSLQLVDAPEKPVSPLSVIVKNQFIPVLPYDWETEYGLLKAIRPVQLPMVIGYGFGGVVEEVGLLRDKNLIGQKVIGAQLNGAARETINSQIPPLLFKVPDNVALRDAVTIIGGADAALNAVNVSDVKADDVVLVTGASGGVGTYLIQLLKRQGAQVIALASEDNRQFVQEQGADLVLNYEQELTSQLAESPHFNKIIDTVGRADLLDLISANSEALDILSLSMTSYQPRNAEQNFTFSHDSIGISGYKQLLKMMADGEIHAVIQEIFPFEDVKKAHLQSKDGHSRGRILLTF